MYKQDGEASPNPHKRIVKRKTVHKKSHRSRRPKTVTSSIPDSPPGTVTFTPDVGSSLTVLLHDSTPVITDGYSQWEVVDRPKRLGMTRFKGKNPFKQDISVMFDGWIDESPQETNISSLMKMTQQPHALAEPPKIKLSGQAHRKDLIWVIEGIDWDTDNTIWEISGSTPVRLRQSATVHLLQFVEDTVVTTAASPAVVAKKGGKRKKVVGVGLTLKQIAQQEYGDPNGWHEILMQNIWLKNWPPRKPIPPGKMIQIPYWHGVYPHTIVIGQ